MFKVPAKPIIDEPYEEWSTGADFELVDESDDQAVDQMVDLIEEGFKFRKDMFKGGLTGNDLARMRLVKKPKEKEPKEKLDKDNVAEVTEGESSDSRGVSAITDLVASQMTDKLSSSTRDIRQELSSLEGRLEKFLDAKFENLERKFMGVVVDNLKIMQSAIIKASIDSFNIPNPSGRSMGDASGLDTRADRHPIGSGNPPEPTPVNIPAAISDSLINEVLIDLNGLSDGQEVPLREQIPKVAANETACKVSIFVATKS